MIKHDPVAAEQDAGEMTFARLLMTMGAGLLMVFAVGVAAGMGASVAEHGIRNPLKLAAGIALVAVLAVASFAVLRRNLAQAIRQPAAANIRKARFWFAAMGAVGVVISLFLPLDDAGLHPSLLGDSGITPGIAAALIAAWVVLVPLMSWLWWRQIDEVERFAYRDGGFWAINFYAVVTPSWWVGWRGGLFVEPMHMAIFIAAMAVWTIAWLARRYG